MVVVQCQGIMLYAKTHIGIIATVLVAFLLRIFFAIFLLTPSFSRNDDLSRYRDWGKVAFEHGVTSSYYSKYTSFGIYANNQPPGTVYIDYAMYSVYRAFYGTNESNEKTYDFFIKIPGIVADCGIGILIYLCLVPYIHKRFSILASTLFLFNPIVIYNSSIWGQTDALTNIFLMAAITTLLYKKNFLAVLFLFTSLLIKLSLLPLIPVLLLFIIKSMGYEYKKFALYVVISLGILGLFILPISSNPLLWSWKFLISNSSGELQHITNYAFNFWSILFNPDYFANVPLSSDVYFGLSLSAWGYILFGIFYCALIAQAFRRPITIESISAILFMSAFAMYLFLPRMHERYLYPVFPLFALYIGFARKHYFEFIILTLINFINLYVTWHPFPFLPVLLTNLLAHSKIRLGMSVLLTVTFLYLFRRLFYNRIKNHAATL